MHQLSLDTQSSIKKPSSFENLKFWPIFDFELNEKRSRAEPKILQLESGSSLARASSARTHH